MTVPFTDPTGYPTIGPATGDAVAVNDDDGAIAAAAAAEAFEDVIDEVESDLAAATRRHTWRRPRHRNSQWRRRSTPSIRPSLS